MTKDRFRPSAEASAGGCAALVNIFLCYPIYKTMWRQQAYGYGLRQSIRSLVQEGPFHLYRGVQAPLLQKTGSVALMFGMYHLNYAFLWPYLAGGGDSNPVYSVHGNNDTATIVFAGLATGTCEAVCFTPIERVQALLQAKEYNTRFKGFFNTLAHLRLHGGFTEYYRGFSAIAMRNGPQTALFFYLKPPVTRVLNEQTFLSDLLDSNTHALVVDFCSGAAIGAFGSTIFYPLGVAKSRMQCQLGGAFVSPFTVVRSLKARQLYSGVQTNLMRAVMSWGVINAIYEFFVAAFRRL